MRISAARKLQRGFTLTEMLAVLVLLAVLMLISAPMFGQIVSLMRHTSHYEDRTDAWLAARNRLARDVWTARKVRVVNATTLFCYQPERRVEGWRIFPNGNLLRSSVRNRLKPLARHEAIWRDAAWGLSFKRATVGVEVKRDCAHQISLRLLPSEFLRAKRLLEGGQ